LFWHSQTTDDDYLGVEMNGFVKNSIESGAASAGWSFLCKCETNLAKILLTVVLLLLVDHFLQMWKKNFLSRCRTN
jgi:hypothetical protein